MLSISQKQIPLPPMLPRSAYRGIEREDRLVRGPVGQRKGEVLIPGRSRMTRECILLNSGSETLKKVQEAMKSGKL